MGHASATTLGRDDAEGHECRVERLDEVLKQMAIERVDFIKMDVEGHELDVLEGCPVLLSSKSAPIIAFEVNQVCLRDRGLRADDLRGLLSAHGYELFCKVGRSGRLIRWKGALPDVNADYVAARPEAAGRVPL
jgi:hypothetical protein